MSPAIEQIMSAIDANLPWILPSLETVETVFPLPLRLLAAVALSVWLTRSRLRAASEQPA